MKRAAIVLVLLIAAFGAGYVVRWRSTPAASNAPKQERKIAYWYDPMHPAYKSDKPGIAPDCGMDLVPMYSDGSSGDAPSTTTISVSPEQQQQIGVRTGYAELVDAAKTLRATGRVMVDESRVARVQSRTEGWIEKVHVDTTGRTVKHGTPLVQVYSPELVASQQEYLLALKARESMSHASMTSLQSSGNTLVDAARARLERHWHMDAATLAELEKRGEPVRSVAIPAPIDGYVMTRNAYANQRVTPEMELYTLADLSHVWIVADVPEADAANVRLGQVASIELVTVPGKRIMARVTNLGPQMDAQTRTLKVRLEAENASMLLRPDLFVNVEFHTSVGKRLRVAEDAVIDTGVAQTVFIDKGNGVFEPRRVQTGERAGGFVEIVSGLDSGERIALSGAFLLDSESKMRGVAPQAKASARHD